MKIEETEEYREDWDKVERMTVVLRESFEHLGNFCWRYPKDPTMWCTKCRREMREKLEEI